MTNSVDSDQMASSEAFWSGAMLFAKIGVVVNSRIRVNYLGSQKIIPDIVSFHIAHFYMKK